MKLKGILTGRRNTKDPWYDIVYEWVDVVSSRLSLPLVHILNWGWRKSIYLRLIRAFRRCWNLHPMFYFQMRAWQWEGHNRGNLYPCLIDFFSRTDEELALFYRNFSHNPLVMISSREAFEFLIAKKCPLKITSIFAVVLLNGSISTWMPLWRRR